MNPESPSSQLNPSSRNLNCAIRSFRFRHFVTVAIALGTSAPAGASFIYQFESPNYIGFNPAHYNASMHVELDVALLSALPANMVFSRVDNLAGFNLSGFDGAYVLGTTIKYAEYLATDSAGNISNWNLTTRGTANFFDYSSPSSTGVQLSNGNGIYAQTSAGGTWTTINTAPTPASIPEPGTLVFGAGVLAFVGTGRVRKTFSHSAIALVISSRC